MRVTRSRVEGRGGTGRDRRRLQRGQGLVIFAAAIVFFIGFLAIVIDVTWYWMNTLKVQRAADAAALAGAVMLPDNPSAAVSRARAEATKNGYTSGVNGATVTAAQNPSRDIQLDTSVTAPVSTFFMHLFGINTITASRKAAAEYVLPVPMGSPINYFGAFGAIRGWIRTDTGRTLDDPGLIYPTANGTPGAGWTNVSAAYTLDATYATATATSPQTFGTFHVPTYLYGPSQRYQANGGIEVTVTGHSNKASGCQVKVDVSPDNGTRWYGSPGSNSSSSQYANNDNPGQTLGIADTDLVFGGHQSTGATDYGDWFGMANWASSMLTDALFKVRVTPIGAGCTDSIDAVGLKITYEASDPPILGPHGEPLQQQGVWATVNSQGSEVINGDAYSSQKNGSGTSTQYNPTGYYDYALEMQPGTSGGSVYVFDPVFCATNGDGSQGMGDRWYGSATNPGMSTFYRLYDTNNTLYDLSDDTLIASSGDLFKRSMGSDPDQGGPTISGSVTDCRKGAVTDQTKGGYWHNRWWRLASAVAGPAGATPRIYRIRVTSTDPSSSTDQASINAQNSFSFFGTVAGHTCPASSGYDSLCPRVYGLGAMQAFSPLDPSTAVVMYFSQISATYAGKTMKVTLWDPGDANQLQANLSFLMPTATGYQAASFTWTAKKFATSGQACTASATTPVSSLRTNNSGSSTGIFNGCWVTISIPVPTNYTAPTPPGEPGPGWWKIRYTMGSGSNPAFDLTTWKTQIVGNPVHLVTP